MTKMTKIKKEIEELKERKFREWYDRTDTLVTAKHYRPAFDRGFDCAIEYDTKIIEELKSEIERLKKSLIESKSK